MTFCVPEFRVLWGISIWGGISIKFRVFKRHFLLAMGALSILLAPLQCLELPSGHRLTALVIPKLLGYFSAISEE